MNIDASRREVPSQSSRVAYDDAPLRPFHARVALASTGGVFSDGFGLGIIGIALSLGSARLQLTPTWFGLLGGASLAGLFLGALGTGPVADRFGRRPVFAYNMALLAVFSLLQFWVTSRDQLLALRLLIGFMLGTDYVASKALLTEFTPRLARGRIMSLLSVAWAAGYTIAYLAGMSLIDAGPDAWRWMLLSSAAPCLAILPFRITMPETPLWLAKQGYTELAAKVVREKFGDGVMAPEASLLAARAAGRWRQLFSPAWRRRTAVACAFFTCQVIPFFAIGTFVPRVMSALKVENAYLGGVFYNLALMLGAIVGLVIVDRLSRRQFLVGSFATGAIALMVLSVAGHLTPAAVIVLLGVFACVLQAASNLVYVYLPELFPTDLRASGVGLAIATSRIGSAASTFLLPILVADFGVRSALATCVAVLIIGGAVCYRWAPETRRVRLGVEPA